MSNAERQFTGADLKWPNPSRPMYFLISTGNEEMASTGEKQWNRCKILTTQGLSMKTSRSLMPSLTYMSFFYQWSLNVFTPLWPLNLFLSFSITHSTLGTSFLNRTEAASVEKIVTMYLKNGITPDQIGVRHSYPFNSYYPSLFFSVIHFISVCPYLRLSLIDVTWFFFARRTFLTPFFLACVSTIR